MSLKSRILRLEKQSGARAPRFHTVFGPDNPPDNWGELTNLDVGPHDTIVYVTHFGEWEGPKPWEPGGAWSDGPPHSGQAIK